MNKLANIDEAAVQCCVRLSIEPKQEAEEAMVDAYAVFKYHAVRFVCWILYNIALNAGVAVENS